MGIFAGAPRPAEGDPWVVIARPPSSNRKVSRTTSLAGMSKAAASATIGRASLRHAASSGKRLSRIVDAVIDSPQPNNGEPGAGGSGSGSSDNEGPPPALERALRRGLSDSSIHTTFTQHGDEPHPEPGPAQPMDRESVLQALSRKMQSFRFTSATPAPAQVNTAADVSSTSRPQTPTRRQEPNSSEDPDTPKRSPPRPIPRPQQQPRSTSLFGLSSWAAAFEESDDAHDGVPTPYYAGSPREEEFIRRDWPRQRDL